MHAYPIEIAVFVLASCGFLLAVWNAYDEWKVCDAIDLDTEPARNVLRGYEHAGVAILIAMAQLCSVTVAGVVTLIPPPPMPIVARSADDFQLFVSLIRASGMVYAALIGMTSFLLAKSVFRRISRRIYTRRPVFVKVDP